jgi:hypothetical protein
MCSVAVRPRRALACSLRSRCCPGPRRRISSLTDAHLMGGLDECLSACTRPYYRHRIGVRIGYHGNLGRTMNRLRPKADYRSVNLGAKLPSGTSRGKVVSSAEDKIATSEPLARSTSRSITPTPCAAIATADASRRELACCWRSLLGSVASAARGSGVRRWL